MQFPWLFKFLLTVIINIHCKFNISGKWTLCAIPNVPTQFRRAISFNYVITNSNLFPVKIDQNDKKKFWRRYQRNFSTNKESQNLIKLTNIKWLARDMDYVLWLLSNYYPLTVCDYLKLFRQNQKERIGYLWSYHV